MSMTPGQYLARRREAAGLAVEDVALRVETTPYQLQVRERVEWLRNIESGVMEVGMREAVALHPLFPFSIEILAKLVAHGDNPARADVRLCRICGCSQEDACAEGPILTCAWTSEDLCTACTDEHRFVQAHTAAATGSKAA